jgi:hypothetical protein
MLLNYSCDKPSENQELMNILRQNISARSLFCPAALHYAAGASV